MQFKLLCCWDCGERIIDGTPGAYTPQSRYRRVRFALVDGSYMEPGFCVSCAARAWTPERFRALERAIGTTAKQVQIMKVEGEFALHTPILGVLGG